MFVTISGKCDPKIVDTLDFEAKVAELSDRKLNVKQMVMLVPSIEPGTDHVELYRYMAKIAEFGHEVVRARRKHQLVVVIIPAWWFEYNTPQHSALQRYMHHGGCVFDWWDYCLCLWSPTERSRHRMTQRPSRSEKHLILNEHFSVAFTECLLRVVKNVRISQREHPYAHAGMHDRLF